MFQRSEPTTAKVTRTSVVKCAKLALGRKIEAELWRADDQIRKWKADISLVVVGSRQTSPGIFLHGHSRACELPFARLFMLEFGNHSDLNTVWR
jgi:hypothetical protein